MYLTNGPERAFVARFKYARKGAEARRFAGFLVKHFTPGEYFAAMASGLSPLPILQAKGYVSINIEVGARLGDATCLKMVARAAERRAS